MDIFDKASVIHATPEVPRHWKANTIVQLMPRTAFSFSTTNKTRPSPRINGSDTCGLLIRKIFP